MSRFALWLMGAVGVFLGVAGCGRSADPNRPKTVPVTVTVTYNGQPAQGATVTFHPAATQPRGAIATTDAQGRAAMWTFDPGDGVIPGPYKVTISKISAVSVPKPDQTNMAEYEKALQKMQSQPPKHELPEKYNGLASSGLTADVADKGRNEFAFELKN